jgi:hypothetical protein
VGVESLGVGDFIYAGEAMTAADELERMARKLRREARGHVSIGNVTTANGLQIAARFCVQRARKLRQEGSNHMPELMPLAGEE